MNVKTPLEASSNTPPIFPPFSFVSLLLLFPSARAPSPAALHTPTPLSRLHLSPPSHLTSLLLLRRSPFFLLCTRFLSPCRPLTRLPALTCHSNRLPPSLALSIRRFSSPSPPSPSLSPLSLRASMSGFSSSSPSPDLHSPLHPPVLSLLHPVFLLSDQALFSLHPFLRLVRFTLVIHTDTVFGLNFCLLVLSCLFSFYIRPFSFHSSSFLPVSPFSSMISHYFSFFLLFFLHELAHARSSLITGTNQNQT